MTQIDLIVLNGRVHTMDPAHPTAQAVAIGEGRIAAIGSSEQIRLLAYPQTRIVDAGQATVLPGFNDAHVHFLAGGFSLSNVNLRNAGSAQELAEGLAGYARTLPPGRWIQGGDWDHENWAESGLAPLPTRQLIDSVTANNPVLVTRLDGHMALANTPALHLAGISRHTPDPAGGVIVRDPQTGEPTGILKDAAQTLVERIIPPKSTEEKGHAARAATRYAAACGVTSLTDVSTDDDLALYEEMLSRNELLTRVYAARSIVNFQALLETGLRAASGNPMLRTGILKGFSDGSLGSSTALFFEPYADDPQNRGLLFDQMFPEGIMRERVDLADRAGLQVMIHAIGDEANSRILDLYHQVEAAHGQRDRRFRIEHAQHLRPQDVPRFGRERIIASMQPYHAADDGRWCEKRLGKKRCQTAYAFRSLLNTGAVLAFGSDWTVAPLNPLLGIKAAVTRQTLDGHHPNGWIPDQRISLDEAIHAYTVGSAFAEFTESSKGTLAPGKLADLVVLDRDIYNEDPSNTDKASVILTVLGGKIVYDARDRRKPQP